MKKDAPALTVGIIGGGPIGLAAAAHALERGLSPIVFEMGPAIAAHLESYRHVRLFSPWRYNIDFAARRLLSATAWRSPPDDELPTAGAMVDQYLLPLSRIAAVAAALRLSHRVEGVARVGFDKARSKGRENVPFVIRCGTGEGTREFEVDAVIDASGSWGTPNPLGANGLPAIGERELSAHLAYGMPDILGADRARYTGKRVLVAGAGHSAAGSLLALATLAEQFPGTRLVWTIRGHDFARIFGGGENDGLAARGALGKRLRQLAETGLLDVQADFLARAVRQSHGHLLVEGRGVDGSARMIEGVDEIIVAAGGRPDLSIASELRVKLDPWLESTEQLAPLIDPNLHSCGSVRPHGHRELQHPEYRFYIVGAKSYGRAPNFLLATGHEQVRSVVAALAGDLAAADDVRLELPETGVCSSRLEATAAACCAGPANEAQPACCMKEGLAQQGDASSVGCAPPAHSQRGRVAASR